MKKLGLMILPALLLTACDNKPIIQDFDVVATSSEDRIDMNLTIHKDKAFALITKEGNTEEVEFVKNKTMQKDTSTAVTERLIFKGKNNQDIELFVYIDKINNKIEHVHLAEKTDEDSWVMPYFYPKSEEHGHGDPELWPDVKPFYEKPSETDICIKEISDLVDFQRSVSGENYGKYTHIEFYSKAVKDYVTIPAEDAIKLSANWDYDNEIKPYYNLSEPLKDYEKDACETLERLNQYIKDNNLKK